MGEQVVLEAFQHDLQRGEDVDVQSMDQPVLAGLRVELVHLAAGRRGVGTALVALAVQAGERTKVVEDVEPHEVLHVIHHLRDAEGFCQGVGQHDVVLVLVDAPQALGVYQFRQQ